MSNNKRWNHLFTLISNKYLSKEDRCHDLMWYYLRIFSTLRSVIRAPSYMWTVFYTQILSQMLRKLLRTIRVLCFIIIFIIYHRIHSYNGQNPLKLVLALHSLFVRRHLNSTSNLPLSRFDIELTLGGLKCKTRVLRLLIELPD